MSAFEGIADSSPTSRLVRKGATSGLMHRSENASPFDHFIGGLLEM
jgi:hypothetical protein